ncbi:predicted amidohydrolase [Roseburia sp. CAG:303]|nr:predicted amidohydrolase [Roseburia sp. CAG:303]
MEFSGESIVVDANGEVLKKADDSEQILYVDIEPENVISIRKKRSYTDLRRPELYH